MRNIFKILIVTLIFTACSGVENDKYPIKQPNWKSKEAGIVNFDNYALGKTYLPVYSSIYQIYESKTFELTTTVSIRNISETDSVYILKADYYNTIGENIRQYLKSPIYLMPLETIEIVIEKQDKKGGTGANFVFQWAVIKDKNPPLFEAVMISADGAQGLAFSTRGVQILE
jgi:hypothetical protein